MRCGYMGRSAGLAAMAALALTLGSPQASACEAPCGHGGYGYAAAYAPPPAYSYYAPVYAAPPVYTYSHYGPAYGGYAAPPTSVAYYTTRINVFHGPRWTHSAAYYRSPPRYRGCRRFRRVGVRSPCDGGRRPYIGVLRPSMYGPIVPISRRW